MPSHDVTPLQTALSAKGYTVLVDGVFGTQTKSAMQAYEKANNLTVSDQPTLELVQSLGVTLAADFPYQPLSPKPTGFQMPDFQIPASIGDYAINFLSSKINWFAGILAGAIVVFINTHFGFTLDAGTTAGITTLLVTILTGGVWLLRTFFNSPKVIAGTVVK